MSSNGGRLRASLWPAAVLTLVVAAGCGSTTVPSAGTTATTAANRVAAVPTAPPPPPIVWSPCPSNSPDSGRQCGTVEVPLDYEKPDGQTLALAVTRAPALSPTPRGTIVFNPGGPGESGNKILPVALALVPTAIRDDFNIVSFDPRGTGSSEPLDCGTSASAAASVLPVPSPPGGPLPGTGVFTSMARACEQQVTTPFIDTVNTARDMDRIRQALGLSTITYYGLSYGTVLGAEYAQLFPHRIATMVLDGSVDVDATLTQQAEEAAPAEERSLDHLFAECPAEAPCPLGPHPATTFSTLAASLTRHPLPAPGSGDNDPVTVGDLDTATLYALSVPEATAPLLAALVAAEHGNGGPLRGLSLEFETDVDGAPLVDALWAITCNDAAQHPGPVAAGDLATALHARYPLLGAYAVTYTMAGCVSWPAGRTPVVDLHPKGTPPILVIGNTGDPNTPYVGAQHLAAIFPSGRLLTWQGWGHTWLLSGSTDQCMQRLVTTYLSGGGLPPAGTVCH
jgi:pimeloyl-ACP methyl ester carboxylesterase